MNNTHTKTNDEGTFDPVTCSLIELDNVIFKIRDTDTQKAHFYLGVLHARTVIAAATGGRVGK